MLQTSVNFHFDFPIYNTICDCYYFQLFQTQTNERKTLIENEESKSDFSRQLMF